MIKHVSGLCLLVLPLVRIAEGVHTKGSNLSRVEGTNCASVWLFECRFLRPSNSCYPRDSNSFSRILKKLEHE